MNKKKFLTIRTASNSPSLKELGFKKSTIKVTNFKLSKKNLKSYDEYRNFPAFQATTYLSVHLQFGTISIRQCVSLASKYSPALLKELVWREFFMQILWNFPQVVDQPFKDKYAGIEWNNNPFFLKLGKKV